MACCDHSRGFSKDTHGNLYLPNLHAKIVHVCWFNPGGHVSVGLPHMPPTYGAFFTIPPSVQLRKKEEM